MIGDAVVKQRTDDFGYDFDKKEIDRLRAIATPKIDGILSTLDRKVERTLKQFIPITPGEFY